MKMKMGPFCKSPGRVLLHIVMSGFLSQVMDKANGNVVNENMNVENQNMNVVHVVNVVKDNVGVVAVLAMHSVNVDKITEVMDKTIVNMGNMNMVKNIELRYAREVRNNVMYVVNVVKDSVGVVAVLAMHSVNRNNDTKEESEKGDVNVIMNEDNPEQVVEMKIIDKDHGDVDVIDSDMIKTNLKVEKQPYEKPEEKDVGDDIDSDSDADTEYN
jgi:hypothetical protein